MLHGHTTLSPEKMKRFPKRWEGKKINLFTFFFNTGLTENSDGFIIASCLMMQAQVMTKKRREVRRRRMGVILLAKKLVAFNAPGSAALNTCFTRAWETIVSKQSLLLPSKMEAIHQQPPQTAAACPGSSWGLRQSGVNELSGCCLQQSKLQFSENSARDDLFDSKIQVMGFVSSHTQSTHYSCRG